MMHRARKRLRQNIQLRWFCEIVKLLWSFVSADMKKIKERKGDVAARSNYKIH
jgi:hypothetical protein